MAEAEKKAVIVIPARLGSRRFAGKMLALLAGKPVLAHAIAAAQQAGRAAGLGAPVFVAADGAEIAGAARRAGAEPVMTPGAFPSGSDRVAAAIAQLDPGGRFDPVINWQGDLPALPPGALADALALHRAERPDITTLAAPLAGGRQAAAEQDKVKAVLTGKAGTELAPGGRAQALFFTRAAAPCGGPYWHHIGLYIFTRTALARFAALAPSPLEKQERLEQLRALEAGMILRAALIARAPTSIDRQDDLKAAAKEHGIP